MSLYKGIPAVINDVPNYGIPIVFAINQGIPAIMPYSYNTATTPFYFSSSTFFDTASLFYISGSNEVGGGNSWTGSISQYSIDLNAYHTDGNTGPGNVSPALFFNPFYFDMPIRNLDVYEALVEINTPNTAFPNPVGIGLQTFPGTTDRVCFEIASTSPSYWECTVGNSLTNQLTTVVTNVTVSSDTIIKFKITQSNANTMSFYLNGTNVANISMSMTTTASCPVPFVIDANRVSTVLNGTLWALYVKEKP